jgi:iron complex transport system substrate-binding protein
MTQPTRLLLTATAAVVLLAGAACGSDDTSTSSPSTGGTEGFPVTVASCGKDFGYDQAPDRVLLGAPGIIDTLDALGVADSAIGYTLGSYATDEPQRYRGLTQISEDYTPSREFLVSAQPDLYLSNDEQQLLGEGAASTDDLAAIPANFYVLGGYCVDSPAPTTIDAVYRDITNLGAVYGISDRAEQVNADLLDRVTQAAARNTTGEQLTAAAVQVYDGKVYALAGSYYAAVLESLGMTNTFDGLGENFSEISREQIAAATPDVVFAVYSGDAAARTEAIAETTKLFANAPAATQDRVFAWSENDFQAAGVRIVQVIEDSAANVWPPS